MKRRISIILACVLACAMLAGCGKKPEQGSSGTGDTSVDAVENGSAAAVGGDGSTAVDAPENGNTSTGQPNMDPGERTNSEESVGDSGIPYIPVAPDDDSEDAVPVPEPPADSGKLHVSVATVDISMDQLKAQDYKVPVLVTLDKNPGIIYSEWGLHIDPKCTFTSDSDECKFKTVYVNNDEQHFVWTAWVNSAVYTKTGSLLQVELKLPMDAKPGDFFTVGYADTSLAKKGDVWSDGETDYANMDGGVTWTDGGVNITN